MWFVDWVKTFYSAGIDRLMQLNQVYLKAGAIQKSDALVSYWCCINYIKYMVDTCGSTLYNFLYLLCYYYVFV
jgi:hypothetical protein